MNNKILPIALMFDDAYNILHDKMQSGAKYHNEKNLALITPVAVNCAFACELFLKSMLPDGTRGHELKELFDLLKSYEPSLANDIQNEVIFILRDIKKYDYSIDDFENDLYVNNNIFNEWRYCHEKTEDISFGVQFMYIFEQCLKTFALKDC